MRTNRLLKVFFLLLLVVISAILIFRFNLWNIRGVEPSEVYRQWEDAKGVQASFIKDYRVNDTVAVDITLLEAYDSVGWLSLKKDFKIIAILDSIFGHTEINETTKNIRLAPKNNYNLPADHIVENNDLIVTNFHNHIICIFHIKNEEQYYAICNKQFDEMNPKF